MLLRNKKYIQLWLILIITFLISTFLCKKIKLNQNIIGLLPDTINNNSLNYIKRIGLLNKIFIDLSINNNSTNMVMALERSAFLLGKDIQQTKIFTNTFFKLSDNYQLNIIEKLLPYLPNLTTRDDISYINKILKPTYIKKALLTDFTILNTPLISTSNIIRLDPLGLSKLLINKLKQFKPQKNAYINDNGFLISKDKRHILIWTSTKLPLTDAKNAEKVNQLLYKLLKKDLLHGVNATVIGTLPHTLANARAIKYDLRHLLPITTLALLLLFLIFFRDIKLLCAISIPFLCAPIAIIITTAILRWHIYAIALGFGLVLFGIAIDYSVHIYFSLTRTHKSKEKVLIQIKKPLVTAYLTTIGVFIVLLFSKVPSHRQMALLSIIGLTLSFLISWFLVPSLVNPKNDLISHKKMVIKQINKTIAIIRITFWVIMITLGFIFWSKLHYNVKLTSLEYIPKYISYNEKIFHKVWGYNSNTIIIILDSKNYNNLSKTLDINDLIYHHLKLQNIKILSISTILPGNLKQFKALKRWDTFWEKKKYILSLITKYADQLGFNQSAFNPFFYNLFHHKILSLKILLNSDIKYFIKNFIIKTKKQYYILTIIYNNTSNKIYYNINQFITELKKHIKSVNINIISNKIWQQKVEKLLHSDLLNLSIAASIIIFIIVWIYLKKPLKIMAALSPVISSLSAMSLFSFLTQGDINILNILMGIMVIGLSVDYGIFIVSSFKKEISESSKTAVTMCALSTLIGFGALALAKHPALKSLGITVLVGILAAWPTAIWIAPAILSLGSIDD